MAEREDEVKIIMVDNFGRERISDKLIAENVYDFWGERIVKLLNEKYSGNYSPEYFKLVEDNHKLYVFEP